jgi:hypothetical protein
LLKSTRQLKPTVNDLSMMGARAVIETAMVLKVGPLLRPEMQPLIEHTARLQKQLNTVMDIVENLLHSLFVLAKPSAELKAGIPPRPPRPKKK